MPGCAASAASSTSVGRNPASVLPPPVGAISSTLSPARAASSIASWCRRGVQPCAANQPAKGSGNVPSIAAVLLALAAGGKWRQVSGRCRIRRTWLRVLPQGLYCEPGGFFIDPTRAVDRAVITHAHSDHARPGHRAVLASADTLALMRARLGEERAGETQQALGWGETLRHRRCAAVARSRPGMCWAAPRWRWSTRAAASVVSGDYKRTADPTCAGFEPVPCDVFVTEATFALPVFRHPPPGQEIGRLLASVALFPDRTHVVGCYALGKCQRLIALLREAGWDRPIWLHGALVALCQVYEARGVALGDLRPATAAAKGELVGAIVLAPPGAVTDRWARRLADPVVAMASGWMRVRQRAKSRGVELPLVISDHADWDELNATLDEVGAPEVWVTHGREEALIHAAGTRGIKGRALRLVGYGDEDEEPA